MTASTSPVDLAGRVVIVTGAAQGQGAAEARHLRDLGAMVVLADVGDESGVALAAEIGATYQHTDVSSAASWDALIDAVMAAHGRLDVLVNNAAVHWFRLIEDEKVEDFDRSDRGESARHLPRYQGGYRTDAGVRRGLLVNIASVAGPWLPGARLLRSIEMGGPGVDQDGGGRARPERNPGQCGRAGHHRHAHGVGRRPDARWCALRPPPSGPGRGGR